MEKEPLEEAGPGPGPGKVEKRDRLHGDGWVFVFAGSSCSFIPRPIPNQCSLLHFWRHFIINLFLLR